MTTRIKLALALESTAGGTRKHVREIALGMAPREYEVHLVASFTRSREMLADLPALRSGGVRVHVLPMRREIAPADDGVSLGRLVRLFRRESFDVVHTHSAKAGFLGRLAARRAGVRRVIHTPHVWPFQWTRGPARMLYFRLERLAARWSDHLVCVGPGQKAVGLASRVAPEGKLVVIENGVDPALYGTHRAGRANGVPASSAASAKERARALLDLLPGELAVGMIARIAPQKGVGRFLEAAAAVSRERRDVRFFLAGSGPLERRVHDRARALGLGPARLQFLGHREDASRLYAAFDVFALSSLYEGLPYVILEAMAARLPVVATRAPGIEDLVEDGVTGRLASLDDPAAIAGALVELLGDEDARSRMGEEARRRVEERFRLSDFLEAHARLYKGNMEGPR